jgi:monothiol glutaredoxin
MSDVNDRIKSLVETNRVVLFMKGDKNVGPMCGFSARALQIVNALGVEYETLNVLDDPEIREGVKAYSNWPTIPQLYVDGQFIGGSDIAMEMFQSGELQKLIDAKA